MEEFYTGKENINEFIIWDSGKTAYLQRKDASNKPSIWERVNLKTKKVKTKLKPGFKVSKGISGNNNKLWTTPEKFFTLMCLDRDLRPIFLDLRRS